MATSSNTDQNVITYTPGLVGQQFLTGVDKLVPGQTYNDSSGKAFVFKGLDDKGNAQFAPSTLPGTSPSALNPAQENLDYVSALQQIGQHNIDLGDGTSLTVFTPPDPNNPGHALTDPNTNLPQLLLPDGTPLFGKDKDGTVGISAIAQQLLKSKLGLTAAQTSEIMGKLGPAIEQTKEQTKQIASQTALTDVQTEAAKQQLMGQFSATAAQIASGPGTVESKQKQLDALYNNVLNQYNDVLNKSAALNTYQNTAISQANSRFAAATGAINNAVGSLGNLKFGVGAGGAIAGLLNGLPAYASALGAGPVNLTNPLSLWANGPSGIDINSVPTLDKLFPQPSAGGASTGVTTTSGATAGPKATTSANSSTLLNAWNNGATGKLNNVPTPPQEPAPLATYGIGTTPAGKPPATFSVLGNGPLPASNADLSATPLASYTGAQAQPPGMFTTGGVTPNDILGAGIASATGGPAALTQDLGKAIVASQVNPTGQPGQTGYYNPTNTAPAFGQWTNPFAGFTTSDYANAVRTAMNGTPTSAIGNLPTNGIPLNTPFSSYAKGGTVPGKPGEPQLAIVHGGEHIIPNKVQPHHPVTATHMAQIKDQIAKGATPLQAVLNVHAMSGGDPAALLASIRRGNA